MVDNIQVLEPRLAFSAPSSKKFSKNFCIHFNMMYYCSMYSRELLKGILKPIILKLLSEEERMYGYEIVQKVKEKTEGRILIKEGSLYPTLHALTKEGFLTTESVLVGNRTRKYYSLTQKGTGLVAPAMQELSDFQSTLYLLFGKQKPSVS